MGGQIDRFKDHLKTERERRIKEGRFGVYHILKTTEIGPSFRISNPKHPTEDPNHRIVSSQRNRCIHYFCILDPVLGPMSMCVGSFLPFHCTFWPPQGRQRVPVGGPQKLQAACER